MAALVSNVPRRVMIIVALITTPSTISSRTHVRCFRHISSAYRIGCRKVTRLSAFPESLSATDHRPPHRGRAGAGALLRQARDQAQDQAADAVVVAGEEPLDLGHRDGRHVGPAL